MVEQVKHKMLGSLLKEKGIITESQLEMALEESGRTGKLLGRVLVDMGFVTEEEILKTLGTQSGMEVIDINQMEISDEVIQKVSASIARIYGIIPISFEKNVLTIATSDPLNISILDDLHFMLGCNVKGMVANEDDITRAIQKHYGTEEESIGELLEEIQKEMPMVELDALKESEEAAPDAESLHELANLILLQAIKDRASDIHFEPFESEFKVRYRVDGVLYEMVPPPRQLALAITSRIKVMSNLDIAERRLPQDGRIMLQIGKKNVDLRVSTLPTVFGESVVMRVLDRSVVSLSLDQIGLLADIREKIRELIQKPNGIVLVTGPTGCGR